MAVTNKENAESFTYQELEGFLCKTLSVIPAVSLVSFLWFGFRHKKTDEELERFRNEASNNLIRLMEKSVRDALKIMAFNSPILCFGATIVILALWVLGRFNQMFFYRKAEDFIDDLPTNLGSDYGLLNQTA